MYFLSLFLKIPALFVTAVCCTSQYKGPCYPDLSIFTEISFGRNYEVLRWVLHWVYSLRFCICRRFCRCSTRDVIIDCLETKGIVGCDTSDDEDDDGSKINEEDQNHPKSKMVKTYERIQRLANAMTAWMTPTMISKTEMMRAGMMNILLLFFIAKMTKT